MIIQWILNFSFFLSSYSIWNKPFESYVWLLVFCSELFYAWSQFEHLTFFRTKAQQLTNPKWKSPGEFFLTEWNMCLKSQHQFTASECFENDKDVIVLTVFLNTSDKAILRHQSHLISYPSFQNCQWENVYQYLLPRILWILSSIRNGRICLFQHKSCNFEDEKCSSQHWLG